LGLTWEEEEAVAISDKNSVRVLPGASTWTLAVSWYDHLDHWGAELTSMRFLLL